MIRSYPKRFEEGIDKSYMNWKKELDNKKILFTKKLKQEPNMTQNFYEVAKYLSLKIPEDKNNYLLVFRAYNTLDDSEIDRIRK